MISFPGPVAYAVRSQYETLLADLEKQADQSDCGTLNATGRFTREDNGRIHFECFLYLRDWRARGSSAKERVHIVVQVQETMVEKQPVCVLERSTVRVSYFNIENGLAQLLHSVHFDHGDEEAGHPVFHAQLTRERISLPEETAGELEFEFPEGEVAEVFKNARIPTSDMTLPSVLLCLAADHFKGEFFVDFLARVKELQANMPQPIFAQTKQSLRTFPDHLRSSHWFAHCTQGQIG